MLRMASSKNGRSPKRSGAFSGPRNPLAGVPDHTKRAALAVVFIVLGLFLTLAAFGLAGIAGSDAYRAFAYLIGVGYFLLPVLLFISASNTLRESEGTPGFVKTAAGLLFFISGLGFISIVSSHGGIIGTLIAQPIVRYFDVYVAVIALGGVSLISLLLLLEGRISFEPFQLLGRIAVRLYHLTIGRLFARRASDDTDEVVMNGLSTEDEFADADFADETNYEDAEEPRGQNEPLRTPTSALTRQQKEPQRDATEALKSLLGTYTPPPMALLERDRGKPGVGDIKANANIIKRTLQNFGIVVELDEISIGPSVTRYAIKPAEGVRLSKIVSLQTNLELALAAHPVRIEAPIPGKSMVGIEVPNSTKTTVGLGTLLEAPEFANSPKPLMVALGRDVAGGSVFANLAKMPHLLIAGATGSGKSVTIHTVINSLLYRLGPSQLRFMFIDPKRVELTLYRSVPHLLTPVITEPKRAIMALRWAGKEMQRRYDLLEQHRVRDIESYHENVLAPALKKLREDGPVEGEEVPEAMPYIVIVIDELADIMQTFPRELEAAIVRLAQMSRAVGIHLILSTQRPSVNVITGLIKANVPARIALQVASQVDSRTIIDGAGAEKLLGSGDMLYSAGDGKLIRLQSAFISEGEVKKITDFISKHNDAELPVDIGEQQGAISNSGGGGSLDGDEDVDDDMYEAARAAVIEAGKASTSYLQRKLRVGYARAARLIDLLEERGVIGPGDGAKPREVLERGGTPAHASIDEESA